MPDKKDAPGNDDVGDPYVTNEGELGVVVAKRVGGVWTTNEVADPDTTLDDPPFVTDPNDFPYDDPAAPWNQKAALEVADVFALVAAYDHAVGSPTAPEYATYDEAREAGIVLLTVNENVISFRIDKRTTRKA